MTKLHVIGIGGSGASAVSAIAQFYGFEVSGCDLHVDLAYTRPLKNIPILKGHSADHLTPFSTADMVVVSPAVTSLDQNNPEIQRAHEKGLPVVTWQQFMGQVLQKDKFVIAVCGTHGKSTTTAMIGLILEAGGFDPTVAVGATVPAWGSNFRLGKSRYFVCEADEFNDNFLHYHPDMIALTNIEFDHPEYFADLQAVKDSFDKFFGKLKPGGRIITASPKPRTFSAGMKAKLGYILPRSISGEADVNLKLRKPRSANWRISPRKFITSDEAPIIDYNLRLPGQFNKDNARLAAFCCQFLGVDLRIIKKVLANFGGIGRRFEFRGEVKGVKIFDDYAHHPTAFFKTLETARQQFPGARIFCVFQPHMFSRTRALFGDFVKVLAQAPVDRIIVTDIFASREKDQGIISSKQLVEAVGRQSVQYRASLDDAWALLKRELRPKDVVFNIGAGDIYTLSDRLLQNL